MSDTTELRNHLCSVHGYPRTSLVESITDREVRDAHDYEHLKGSTVNAYEDRSYIREDFEPDSLRTSSSTLHVSSTDRNE